MKIRTLNDLKILGYRPIDFYLTKSCNKTCHYCTSWTKEMRNLTVDLDFLKRTLDMFGHHKIRVDLLGGEPGLVKNLTEVIDLMKKYDNVAIAVLSNSLIRKKYPWILEDPDVYYIEHLVLDFYGDRIEKLGNYDFFTSNELNNYNLMIMTPGYTQYCARHDLNINHKNTILKQYNSRSPSFQSSMQASEIDRKICAAFPLTPVIDFEDRSIKHCSKEVINGSRRFDLTQDNIDKMMNFELFKFEEYCKTCTNNITARSWRTQDEILLILERM